VTRLLSEKREAILAIAVRYGVTNVRVFGSVARGTAGEKSDIDFLIEPNPSWSLLDLIGFKQDLEDLLQRSVDIVTEKGLHQRIKARVLQEAVPL
jgi:uncharacterized protein